MGGNKLTVLTMEEKEGLVPSRICVGTGAVQCVHNLELGLNNEVVTQL